MEDEFSFETEEDKARYLKDPKAYTGIMYVKGLPISANIVVEPTKWDFFKEVVYVLTKAVLVSTLALFFVFIILLCYLTAMSNSDTVNVILTNLIFK